ncbi:MAG: hypothetical protein GX178_09220 [Acidobacteria bacterium]|jgi:hypothetical protein|nr:hypothetical protein [Thermoanaerobaculia bacterium]NLN11769.1 hypothetical protein [Acidobacteriota bacterium]OQC35561.1 MAG: hypothetical protein BWX64_02403 [Acidobacteria bacterium ADurb.Bin051]MBP7813318.1 hypothetical protein [Thermoanaerobaculia bacterium]MBP8845854.1 hypothetical protein [Thermoanaerobaculia bacterium]
MRLWLDDLRPAPDGWTWARDQAQFRRLAHDQIHELEEVAFDFYLEDGDSLECCDHLFRLCRRVRRAFPRWSTHSSSDRGNRLLTERLTALEAYLAAMLAGEAENEG